MVLGGIFNALYTISGESQSDKSNLFHLEDTMELPAVPLDLYRKYATLGVLGKGFTDIRHATDKTNSNMCMQAYNVAQNCILTYKTTYEGKEYGVPPSAEVEPMSVEEMQEASDEELTMMLLTARKRVVCGKFLKLMHSRCSNTERGVYEKESGRQAVPGIPGFRTMTSNFHPEVVVINEEHEIVNRSDSSKPVGGHMH